MIHRTMGNARLTGVARLTSSAGKRVCVRPADGVLYQNENIMIFAPTLRYSCLYFVSISFKNYPYFVLKD